MFTVGSSERNERRVSSLKSPPIKIKRIFFATQQHTCEVQAPQQHRTELLKESSSYGSTYEHIQQQEVRHFRQVEPLKVFWKKKELRKLVQASMPKKTIVYIWT